MTLASRNLAVEMRSRVDRLHFDADAEEIESDSEELEAVALAIFAGVFASLPAIVRAVYRFNRKQFGKVDKAAGGQAWALLLIIPNYSESWYQKSEREMLLMMRESVRKLVRDEVADWTKEVNFASMNDETRQQVKDRMAQRYEVYKSWSINRSDGMITTWNSVLMRRRIEFSGAEFYEWRGVMDDREREAHVLLEGAVISMNSTHYFPGEQYGCRCWAVPKYKVSK